MTDTATELLTGTKLFDELAKLGITKVIYANLATDQYLNREDGTLYAVRNGEEIDLEDDIDDDCELYESVLSLMKDRMRCFAIYRDKKFRNDEGTFFKGISDGTITFDVANRQVRIEGNIAVEIHESTDEAIEQRVFAPDEKDKSLFPVMGNK